MTFKCGCGKKAAYNLQKVWKVYKITKDEDFIDLGELPDQDGPYGDDNDFVCAGCTKRDYGIDGEIGTRLRAITDILEYRGLNGCQYGPWKPGTVFTIAPIEAEWLVKARLAELIA